MKAAITLGGFKSSLRGNNKMIFENIVTYGGVVIFFLYVIHIYNQSVDLYQRVLAQNTNLDNLRVRVTAIYEKLISELEHSGQYEEELLTEIVSMREKSDDSKDLNLASISSTLLRFEQYPEIKTLNLRGKFQDEISALERQVQAHLEQVNKAIMEYNTFVNSFPNFIFCSLWRKPAHSYLNVKN